MKLTDAEKTLLREILDRVQVPGPQCKTYVSLRGKLLDDETEGSTS